MFSDYSKSPSNILEHTQEDATGGAQGKAQTPSAPATNSRSDCVFDMKYSFGTKVSWTYR